MRRAPVAARRNAIRALPVASVRRRFDCVERISFAPNFSAWQKVARVGLQRDLPPERIAWEELGRDEPALDLFDEAQPNAQPAIQYRVPKKFIDVAQLVTL